MLLCSKLNRNQQKNPMSIMEKLRFCLEIIDFSPKGTGYIKSPVSTTQD